MFLINLVTFCILIGSSLSSPCPCQDPSLCKPIQTGERKEIVAFQVDANNWKHYNFSIITTVALFTNLNSEMLCAAHQNGVRVVWGVSYPYEQLGNSTQRSTWIKQMISQVQNTFTDGVNVDIEVNIYFFLKKNSVLTLFEVSNYSRITRSSGTRFIDERIENCFFPTDSRFLLFYFFFLFFFF